MPSQHLPQKQRRNDTTDTTIVNQNRAPGAAVADNPNVSQDFTPEEDRKVISEQANPQPMTLQPPQKHRDLVSGEITKSKPNYSNVNNYTVKNKLNY